MYEQFYGLSGSPFRLTPDHKFYFYSEGHRKAMSYLKYGLYQGEGFIVISGDVGIGKSTLVAQLVKELNPKEVVPIQIGTTQVDGEDAIRLICQTAGLETDRRTKAELLHGLERFLQDQHRLKRRVLLVVDEAQNLPLATLEELRLLSNLQLDGSPLLQGFLLGQPQFLENLARPELTQLQQRVIASYQLQPMSESETEDYVRHRLDTVGWRDDPMLSAGAYSAIHRETQGVPRRINALCNRILLYGALEQLHEVDVRVVDAVIEDLLGEAVSPLARQQEKPSAPADGAGAQKADDGGPLHQRLDHLEKMLKEHEQALHELIDVAMNQFSEPEDGAEPRAARGRPEAPREERGESPDAREPRPTPRRTRRDPTDGRDHAAEFEQERDPDDRSHRRAERGSRAGAGDEARAARAARERARERERSAEFGSARAPEAGAAGRRPRGPGYDQDHEPRPEEDGPRRRRGLFGRARGDDGASDPGARAASGQTSAVDPWGDDPWEAEDSASSAEAPQESERASGLFGGAVFGDDRMRPAGAAPGDPEIDPWAEPPAKEAPGRGRSDDWDAAGADRGGRRRRVRR